MLEPLSTYMGIRVVDTLTDSCVCSLEALVGHKNACTTFMPPSPSSPPEAFLHKKILEDLEFFIGIAYYTIGIGTLAYYPCEDMTYEVESP